MLQLLLTRETKFSNKRPFSGNKKLYTSKEVKEFSKVTWARLPPGAQLDKRWSAEREAAGSSPGRSKTQAL